ncbi:MAG: chemotaxis response regulator protein-glutamate methylesterase [Dehalococcoidales bacterium]|nr:chemotaxis response regulator protein-glutamate methylesterase [Dehalococcoidales bacterium]
MKDKIRAFVVDDSSFVVMSIIKKLQTDSEIEVIGSAHNGREALDKIRVLKPDVITLDVIMPEMDGLTALKHIMSEIPTPVIMLSALTSEGAETTIKALELGAVDFFLKPSALRPTGGDETGDNLIEKIKRAAKSKTGHFTIIKSPVIKQIGETTSTKRSLRPGNDYPVIIIGSSTGGPRALMQVIPFLPKDFPAAVLIVQHMPPLFTKSLADRLNQASQIPVAEAADGNIVEASHVFMAPGGYHMVVTKGNRIRLNQNPPVLGVRPCIDITMKSVADVYGALSIGVVLTGMGTDGTLGTSSIKATGGKTIVQNEVTCAVYGMPQSVVKAGLADKVLHIDRIANELIQMCCSSLNNTVKEHCNERN